MGVMTAAEETAPDLSTGKVSSSREKFLWKSSDCKASVLSCISKQCPSRFCSVF